MIRFTIDENRKIVKATRNGLGSIKPVFEAGDNVIEFEVTGNNIERLIEVISGYREYFITENLQIIDGDIR